MVLWSMSVWPFGAVGRVSASALAGDATAPDAVNLR
jgi:hypothetical protein